MTLAKQSSVHTHSGPTIAVVDWCHLIEDFLDNLGVSFDSFQELEAAGFLAISMRCRRPGSGRFCFVSRRALLRRGVLSMSLPMLQCMFCPRSRSTVPFEGEYPIRMGARSKKRLAISTAFAGQYSRRSRISRLTQLRP